MKKFKKIVAVDPVSIIDSGREELKNYAELLIHKSFVDLLYYILYR